MPPRLPPCGATRSDPRSISPLGVGIAETRPLFVRFGPRGSQAWIVDLVRIEAHFPYAARRRVTGVPMWGWRPTQDPYMSFDQLTCPGRVEHVMLCSPLDEGSYSERAAGDECRRGILLRSPPGDESFPLETRVPGLRPAWRHALARLEMREPLSPGGQCWCEWPSS